MFTTLTLRVPRNPLSVARRLIEQHLRPRPIEFAESAEAAVEFHHEAGAPEGALYVNGRLVGHLPGLTRL
ncbi:MAG: hypothetical protein OEW22_00660 [Rubrivivax sp.]|nr:hypothetical protein [Rubrivivax sp.]